MKSKKIKVLGLLFLSSVLFLFSANPVFAHVIVHPSQTGVATFQEFTMSVPTEKDNPTVAVRLLIPNDLKMVTPNVKPGWKIDVKQNGTGDAATISEITWSGGSIPAGQRDNFMFQAQVPASETTLIWKAYQTYQDGSVVAWDHDPKLAKSPDDDSVPPYSTTMIVNDIKPPAQGSTSVPESSSKKTLAISITALALSAAAFAVAIRKK